MPNTSADIKTAWRWLVFILVRSTGGWGRSQFENTLKQFFKGTEEELRHCSAGRSLQGAEEKKANKNLTSVLPQEFFFSFLLELRLNLCTRKLPVLPLNVKDYVHHFLCKVGEGGFTYGNFFSEHNCCKVGPSFDIYSLLECEGSWIFSSNKCTYLNSSVLQRCQLSFIWESKSFNPYWFYFSKWSYFLSNAGNPEETFYEIVSFRHLAYLAVTWIFYYNLYKIKKNMLYFSFMIWNVGNK